MNELFRTLMTSIKAKFTGLVTKLRLWISPTFWRTQGIAKVRQFFTKLFDIKPKHKKDYYTVFRWMISKKLAFAIVVILGVLCAWYILLMSPEASAGEGGESIRTYKYTSIPLRYYNGKVRILGRGNYVAYVGQVEDGACRGQGSLYRRDGSLVYEGAFEDSMFNGEGKLYYEDGNLEYQGTFVDNLYNGQGKEYRENGSLEYEGNFSGGQRWGEGQLYNSGGNQIFTGNFQNGELIYSEFVGKTTTQAGEMYTGQTEVYTTDTEYCVAMTEIDAVYEVDNGANDLEQEWTVERIHVLKSGFQAADRTLTEINELTSWFGEPSYYGVTNVTLPDAVAVNILANQNPDEVGGVRVTATESFDGLYNVSEYDQSAEVYIYTYEADDLIYTFFSASSSSPNFLFFSIDRA